MPKEKAARAISYPLVVPVGMMAATMDMFLFHPVSVAEDAWDDTNELLWENLSWDRSLRYHHGFECAPRRCHADYLYRRFPGPEQF